MKTETGNVHAGFFPRSISLFRIFLQKTLCVPRQSPPRMNLHLFWRGCEQPFPSRTEALPVNPDPTAPRPTGDDAEATTCRSPSPGLGEVVKATTNSQHDFYSTEANFWVIFSLAVMWFNKRDRCNQIILRNECFKKKSASGPIHIWLWEYKSFWLFHCA